MLTIERSLNVYAAGIPQIINLSQYDSDFQLVFNLYTSQGELTIPSGTTAEIQGTKKSGTGYSAAAALAGNTVTVTGDNQMTACAGANVFEISLKNNGKVLNSVNFILVVEPAALDGGTITDETVLKELQAIIDSVADAEAAADRAEEAVQSVEASAEQIETNKNDIADLKEDLYDVGEIVPLEQGNFGASGNNWAEAKRLRSQWIPVDSRITYTLSVPDGYTGFYFVLNVFSAMNTTRLWFSPNLQTITFKPESTEKYIKIQVLNSTNTAITPSDLPNLYLSGKIMSNAYEQIENISSKLGMSNIYVRTVQGSLNDNGEEASSNARVRTGYIPLDEDYVYTISIPDEDKDFTISFYPDNTGSNRISNVPMWKDSYSFRPSPAQKYMRILVRKKNGANIYPYELPQVLVEVSSYKAVSVITNGIIDRNSNSAKGCLVAKSAIQPSFASGSYGSGICMVHGRLFHFGTGDDAHATYANAAVYTHDGDFNFTREQIVTHNFGHVNTISYNQYNDSLVFGNGSGSYDLAGEFYVYPGFWTKYEQGITQFDIADAVTYSWSVTGVTDDVQFNAVWADENLGRNDLIYLITNDNQRVRLLQLGKGSNALRYGTALSVGDDEFNGTFNVQKMYTQDVGEIGDGAGQSVQYCVQDAEYRNGKLYVGIGHDHFEYWVMTLNEDGSITRESIVKHLYNANGAINTSGVSAIEAVDDFLIIHCTDGYFYTYRN